MDIQKKYGLPSEVRFCARCVISNQRPRIEFDDLGVCGVSLPSLNKKSTGMLEKVSYARCSTVTAGQTDIGMLWFHAQVVKIVFT